MSSFLSLGGGGVQKCPVSRPSVQHQASTASSDDALAANPPVGVGQGGCVPSGRGGGACAGGGPQLTVCRFIAVYNKISSSSHTVAVGPGFLSRKKCPVYGISSRCSSGPVPAVGLNSRKNVNNVVFSKTTAIF